MILRCLLLFLMLQARLAAEFFAGTAKLDITPEAGTAVNLGGQPLAARDALFARVLVLKDARSSVAIVSVDAIVFASPVVAEEAKRQFGVQHVIQCATHTHAGMAPKGLIIGGAEKRPDWTRAGKAPDVAIDWRGLSSDAWYAKTERQIIAAIGEAMRGVFPARIACGRGEFESVYMAHNRRLVTEKGVTMLWENPNRIPTHPLDPTVGVLRIEDMSGKARALAVAYACHPVTLMGAGIVSRDYPGAMVDAVEQELGPQCMAMFLQGASGDLDPYDLHNLRSRNRENIAKQAGMALAKRALAISRGVTVAGKAPVLDIKESLLDIPYRDGRATTSVNVLTLRLAEQIAFAAIPGEPFVQHQIDLRAKCAVLPNVFILGLAYSGRGCPFVVYIPTAQAVKEGGYGAAECSFLATDAGARMIKQAAKQLQ
jgi:hypothetical protein